MTDTMKLLKKLCLTNAPSGNEGPVREAILDEIKGFCDAYTDKSGNIIAFKKGKKAPKYKVMLDAHMDEVGFIITAVTDSGLLRFDTVGGIESGSLLSKRVIIGDTVGVIGMKPVHLSSKEEKEAMPKIDSLYIDIGAKDKADALNYISIGDIGTFLGDYQDLGGGLFKLKAIDDRIGCLALITLLKEESEFDFYATFTVGEELGLRGAKTAAYTVDPDFAIAVDATTASDLYGVADDKTVCKLKCGAVIPHMDRATLYDGNLVASAYKAAKENGIAAQTKHIVAGGTNAGSISLSRGGVQTLTMSLPCRYIHSPSSVACESDINSLISLVRLMAEKMASGNL